MIKKKRLPRKKVIVSTGIAWEYFWPHFEKQDGRHGRFSTFNKDFWWPSRAKGIIGRDLKFAGYVPHYEILTGNIFGLILKNKMATTGVSLQS